MAIPLRHLRPLLAAFLLALAAPSGARASASDPPPGRIAAVLERTLASYSDRAGGADPRYYADGVWHTGNAACWVCNIGPGVGAATLAAERPELVRVAVATMGRALDRQLASGAFAGAGGAADAITTAWLVNDLGTVMLQLDGGLDGATRARWSRSLADSVDYLLRTNQTTWYVNGNINLSYTEALWLAWRITGADRYRSAYEASWSFTLNPPQGRWKGFGLRLTKRPARTDGADGAGYLAEKGAGLPGFDAEYAQLQLDVLASFYALSHEPRALRLMNLLMNGVISRVSSRSVLDARNGSRHSLRTPFLTPALSTLVRHGRDDLAFRLDAQLEAIDQQYAGALTFTHPNFYRGVGSWLATPLIEQDGTARCAAAGAARRQRS